MERQLVKFVDRVKSGSGTLKDISSEYNSIRAQTTDIKESNGFTTEAGELKDNVKKNRYKDILPYDQTRVQLRPLENKTESDYINASFIQVMLQSTINASFIQGANVNKRYIATQGPLSHTVGDFWRMVWQYDVKVIVMACRETEQGKRKCARYWPAHSETSAFGPFVISNLEELSPNEEIVIRTLQMTYQDENRTRYQFQYTAWPDHGIPCTSFGILQMMDMVRKEQGTGTAPILIHCSAGCGRTGVICAVDYVHDLLLTQRIGEDFNIMEIVTAIRQQRPSSVQTKEQYEFVYHTVAQMFQKYLLSLRGTYQNLADNRLSTSVYDNVESVNRLQHQTQPHRASDIQPKSKPSLVSQRPHPLEQTMNDTYAVVNKPKQRPPTATASPAPSPSPPVHLYDNAGLGTPSCPATALYSSVKPKNRCSGIPGPSVTPTYDRFLDHRGAEASSAIGQGDYEPVPGVVNASSRNAKLAGTHAIRENSGAFTSTDDDYEYVSNPVRDTTGYCSPGGMGFNCRIKKPKGPRDPPAEWSRAER